MKILSGAEIAGYMKANQAHTVQSLRSRKIRAKLVIIRDSDNPVILKYVTLKRQYGDDIGVIVEDWFRPDLSAAIAAANDDPSISGVIVQLPLADQSSVDAVLSQISPRKDVDGLSEVARARLGLTTLATPSSQPDPPTTPSPQLDPSISSPPSDSAVAPSHPDPTSLLHFESATATAINWLLTGYDVPLDRLRLAIVGRGRLIGEPLERMWLNSGYDVTVFRHGDDLAALKDFDVIVSATGVPHLIHSAMIRPGAFVVDAGTASEGGILVGDVDDDVRARTDLGGLTPKVGGVGPLTVTALFEHTLQAAARTEHTY